MISHVDGRVSRVLRWRIRLLSATSVTVLLVVVLMSYATCWRYVPMIIDGSFGKLPQILLWMTLLACITVGHGVYTVLVPRSVQSLVFPVTAGFAIIVSTVYVVCNLQDADYVLWDLLDMWKMQLTIQLGGIWAACFCSWLALRQSMVYHKQHC